MITAAPERLRDALPEGQDLIREHYDDLSLHKARGFPLVPQFWVYLEREDRGELTFVALREAGKLIGYFVGFVAPGLHYETCLTCHADIFFISPAHRGRGGALRLFRAVETELRRRGVKCWFVGEKLHKPIGPLMQRLGLEPVERTYCKWLV